MLEQFKKNLRQRIATLEGRLRVISEHYNKNEDTNKTAELDQAQKIDSLHMS